jgi:hypothetical protein
MGDFSPNFRLALGERNSEGALPHYTRMQNCQAESALGAGIERGPSPYRCKTLRLSCNLQLLRNSPQLRVLGLSWPFDEDIEGSVFVSALALARYGQAAKKRTVRIKVPLRPRHKTRNTRTLSGCGFSAAGYTPAADVLCFSGASTIRVTPMIASSATPNSSPRAIT